MYIQFHELKFDQVGSLTLGEVSYRQTVLIHQPSIITIHWSDLVFNDWLQSRDAIRSEEEGREDLYDLYNFRSRAID